MDCQLCQNLSEAYRRGKLPDDMKTQVKAHLQICTKCSENYQIQALVENVINHEKKLLSDPSLADRIMAGIENYENTGNRTVPIFRKILRPLVIATSLAAAIFSGIIIGNIYKPYTNEKTIPVELVLFNDSAIESADVFSGE